MKTAQEILESTVFRNMQEARISEVTKAQTKMKPGWYASSSSIGLTIGPLKTKAEADECMRLSPGARAQQKLAHGTDYPFPVDLRVWKEK